MKILDIKGFINTEKKNKKELFEINKIERYINFKKFVIDINSINSKQIVLILSGENDGYKIYKTNNAYYKSLNSVMSILSNFTQVKVKKKKSYIEYFFILNIEDFIELEYKLYEVCILFRFSSILEIQEDIDEKVILKSINKFSLHGVFSFKRWKRIVSSQMFFDGEHLAGFLMSNGLPR